MSQNPVSDQSQCVMDFITNILLYKNLPSIFNGLPDHCVSSMIAWRGWYQGIVPHCMYAIDDLLWLMGAVPRPSNINLNETSIDQADIIVAEGYRRDWLIIYKLTSWIAVNNHQQAFTYPTAQWLMASKTACQASGFQPGFFYILYK